MHYLVWALVALVAYSLVAPLMKIAVSEIPSDVAVMTTNTILVIAALGVALLSREPIREYLVHPRAPYMYVAGICLAVAIIAYYRALAGGPVSVVVPIFGLFIVGSSVIGILAFEEPLTLRKVLGIGFAVVAVYLTSVE